MEELEAQVESSRADLKSAQKRIDTLHSALKGHEEDFSGDDETREFDDTYGDEDDLSSTASSYKIGEYGDDDDASGFSDEEGSGLMLGVSASSAHTRSWERSTRSKSRDLSPIIDEEEMSSSYGSRRRNCSGGSDELIGKEKRGNSIDEDSGSSNRHHGRDLDLDDDVSASRSRRQRELDDDLKDTKASRTALKSSIDDSETKRSDRYKIDSDDETPSRQRRSVSKEKEEPVTSSRKSKAKKLTDDDDSDDADLEELLRKQKERMRSLIDDDDVYEASSSIRRSSNDDETSPKRNKRTDASPKHEAGVKVNGTITDSREGSEEPSEASHSKQNRRRRQRQRTIELLTSPEHQAIKSNGVK